MFLLELVLAAWKGGQLVIDTNWMKLREEKLMSWKEKILMRMQWVRREKTDLFEVFHLFIHHHYLRSPNCI